ncbi:MAG TPA: hypothetical protein VNO26_01610 [Candidatus Limnocylindria bacterium]|nr:hypothetical protein [Candidatus Limnocylindria bacterium]
MAAAHVTLLLATALVATGTGARAADREAAEAARLADTAISFCTRADRLEPRERAATLERALELAARATERDDTLARAHFAVFCSLGRLVELRGLGWRTLGAVRRVRAAIDRAAELAPDDVDVLVGRGALLLRLPRFLGGDPEEGERCLRRALTLDPWHASGRQLLTQLTGAAPAAAADADLSSAALQTP